jgi:hypothetical protein
MNQIYLIVGALSLLLAWKFAVPFLYEHTHQKF